MVLRHPSVDPMHCGVILENGSVYVWDLGAQAGIRLNGAPIEQGMLRVGDVLTLGAVDLQRAVPACAGRTSTARSPCRCPLLSAAHRPAARRKCPRARSPTRRFPRRCASRTRASRFFGKLGSLFGGNKDKK